MVPSEIEAAYDCAVHYQLQDQGHKFPCKQYLTNVWEGKGNKTWKTPMLSLSDAYLFRADKLYTSHNLQNCIPGSQKKINKTSIATNSIHCNRFHLFHENLKY